MRCRGCNLDKIISFDGMSEIALAKRIYRHAQVDS